MREWLCGSFPRGLGADATMSDSEYDDEVESDLSVVRGGREKEREGGKTKQHAKDGRRKKRGMDRNRTTQRTC